MTIGAIEREFEQGRTIAGLLVEYSCCRRMHRNGTRLSPPNGASMPLKLLFLLALFMPLLLVAAGRWIHFVERGRLEVRLQHWPLSRVER